MLEIFGILTLCLMGIAILCMLIMLLLWLIGDIYFKWTNDKVKKVFGIFQILTIWFAVAFGVCFIVTSFVAVVTI